jgi:hypothetical protein
MREGLNPMEVERRRRMTGWNELAAEKENMLLKFVGFFRGPVLYGECFQPISQIPLAGANQDCH